MDQISCFLGEGQASPNGPTCPAVAPAAGLSSSSSLELYSFTQYFRVLELLAVAAPTVALPSVFTFHILLILARLLSHTSTRIFSVNQSQGQAEGLYKPGTAEPCSRATNEKSYCEKSTEKVFGIEAKKAVKHKIKVREGHKKGKRA